MNNACDVVFSLPSSGHEMNAFCVRIPITEMQNSGPLPCDSSFQRRKPKTTMFETPPQCHFFLGELPLLLCLVQFQNYLSCCQ